MKAVILGLFFSQLLVAQSSKLGDIQDDFVSGNAKTPVSVITDKQARQIFARFNADSNLAWGFSESACQSRAHHMAREMEKQKVISGKIFVEGKLTYAPGSPVWPQRMNWKAHVAPVVYVMRNGKPELMVIDPALGKEPLTVDEWKKRMQLDGGGETKINRTAFGSRFQYKPDDKHKREFEAQDLDETEKNLKAFREMTHRYPRPPGAELSNPSVYGAPAANR